MKCDSCGAPVENGKCTYCGKTFDNIKDDDKGSKVIDIGKVQTSPKKQKKKKNGCLSLILIILLFGMIGSIFDGEKEQELNEADKESNSVWLEGYTDINDFEYYIDGNEIFLTDFNSREKKVRINSSYEIDGKTYNVVSLDGVFTLNNVTSVIIPEGVRSVADNEFNSCGVKFLYLPSTLKDVGGEHFWDYFHDVERIYYGGSKEQWDGWCTAKRSEIGAKQVIYDAKSENLK